MATIYFSGSISGGREDVDLYVAIVDHLRSCGHEVLAGEVVNRSVTHEGEALDHVAIYDRDVGWIREAAERGGVLVAEVSRPSLGVGYEVAFAGLRHQLPVIALWRPGHTARCSAMISGDANVTMIEYGESTLDEMLGRLETAIRDRVDPGRRE